MEREERGKRPGSGLGDRLKAFEKGLSAGELKKLTAELEKLKKALPGKEEGRAAGEFRKSVGSLFPEGAAERAAGKLGELRHGWDALRGAVLLAAGETGSLVAPAFTAIAEGGIAAANAVNQFAAALQGKSVFKKLELDLGKDEGGFRRASGAAKKYRATLLSFDEIHRLNERTGGAGAGAAGIRTGKEKLRETGLIDETIKRLAEKLRQGDFGGVGRILGEKLGEALDGTDWEGFGKKAGGLVSGAFALAGGFFDSGAVKKLGGSLAGFLNGAIAGILPEDVGNGIAGLLFAGVECGLGFLERFKAGEAAEKASAVIRAVLTKTGEKISSVDWAEAGTALLCALWDFLAGFDYKGIASSFWKTFGSFFGAAESVKSALVTGAAERFLGVFRDAFFGEDGRIKSVGEIGGIIRAAILGGFLRFWGVSAFREAAEPFLQGFRDAFGRKNGEALYTESGVSVVSGLISGILRAIGLSAALLGAAGIRAVKTLFGEEAGEKARDVGKLVVNAVLAGVVARLDGTPFQKPAARLIAAFFDPISKATGDLEGKLKSVQDRMKAIGNSQVTVKSKSVGSATGSYLGGYYTQMKAAGGYVDQGDLFIANEAGPELVGTVNGRTAVAPNAEITGIANAVYAMGEREIAAINNLTRALNAKDMTAVVTADSIVAGLARKNRRDGVSTVPVSM